MNLRELHSGLVNGTILIDENGHDPFYGWGSEAFITRLGEKVKWYDEYKDGKLKDYNEDELSEEEHLRGLESDGGCSRCGKTFRWFLNKGDKKIICVNAKLITEGEKVSEWYWEYDHARCVEEYEAPHTFQFEVRDTIVFSNFFHYQMELEDKEEKKQGYKHFSLQSHAGKRRLTDFYASIGTGYQQTTNCGVDIYLNETKDEILIIKESYLFTDEGEVEVKSLLKPLGYSLKGHISCDMWRYMFLNESDLNEKDKGKPLVKLSPKKGIYQVLNYFDSKEWDKHPIAGVNIVSRIKLI